MNPPPAFLVPVQETDPLEKIKTIIKEELRLRWAVLCETIEHYQKHICMQMYQEGMIGKTEDKTEHEKLLKEFCNKLMYEKSVQSLEYLCSQFIKILVDIGGAAKSAGESLKDCWREKVEKEVNVHFLCERHQCTNIQPPPIFNKHDSTGHKAHASYFTEGQESYTKGHSNLVTPDICSGDSLLRKHEGTDSGNPDTTLGEDDDSLEPKPPHQETLNQSKQSTLINLQLEEEIRVSDFKYTISVQHYESQLKIMRTERDEIVEEKGRFIASTQCTIESFKNKIKEKELEIIRLKEKTELEIIRVREKEKEIDIKRDYLEEEEKKQKEAFMKKEKELNQREEAVKKKEDSLSKEEQRPTKEQKHQKQMEDEMKKTEEHLQKRKRRIGSKDETLKK